MPAVQLTIEMAGPLDIAMPPTVRYEGSEGGSVTIRAHGGRGGWYHAAELPPPDAVVALNAGLAAAAYNWSPSLSLIQQRRVPFFFTDYSEYSAERGVTRCEAHGLRLTHPIGLNPFRAPLRQPLVANGAVGFPWISNGFIAGLTAA